MDAMFVVPPLFEAVMRGDRRRVAYLLHAGHSLSVRSYESFTLGDTVLHLALKIAPIDVVNLLIDSGADVWTLDHEGLSGVARVLTRDKLHEVSPLLKRIKRMNPKFRPFRPGCNLLETAVKHCRAETIALLIDMGAQFEEEALISLNSLGWLDVCLNKDPVQALAILRMAIDALGADVQRPLADGRTPLMVMAALGSLDMVKFLLNHGASTEAGTTQTVSGFGLVFFAVQNRDPRVLEHLMRHGMKVSAVNRHGETPLFYCRTPGAADLLLANGVELNHRGNHGETAVIHLLRTGARQDRKFAHNPEDGEDEKLCQREHAKVVQHLMAECGAEVDNFEGSAHYAYISTMALRGGVELVKLLVPFGLHKGQTLLYCAYEKDYESAVVLLQAGASPNFCSGGLFPLICAAMSVSPKMVALLLEWGADPSCRSEVNSSTPSRTALEHLAYRNFAFDPTLFGPARICSLHMCVEDDEICAMASMLVKKTSHVDWEGLHTTLQDNIDNNYARSLTERLLGGNLCVVLALLKKGLNLTYAVQCMLECGQVNVLDQLLSQDEELFISQQPEGGYSSAAWLLQVPGRAGLASLALETLEDGFHVTVSSDSRSAACRRTLRKIAVAKVLLKHGAEPLPESLFGWMQQQEEENDKLRLECERLSASLDCACEAVTTIPALGIGHLVCREEVVGALEMHPDREDLHEVVRRHREAVDEQHASRDT